jgi:transposase
MDVNPHRRQPQQSTAQPFYRRLVERGKPHQIALVAAMRKLLTAIYSVAKHRRPVEPFVSG